MARPQQGRGGQSRYSGRPTVNTSGELWLFGRHAVAAALANPRRSCHTLLATEDALRDLGALAKRPGIDVRTADAHTIGQRLPPSSAHQGMALHVAPLPSPTLDSVIPAPGEPALFLALDQITDPRNLGAILRTAAAFDVTAVILPERHSAELGGVLAKAASGALDIVPIVEVVNLSRAVVTLKEHDCTVIGLDTDTDIEIGATPAPSRLVLVLGSEGEGMRRLVRERCDQIARLPISARVESLNVSVAAGVALYAVTRGRAQRTGHIAAGVA